MKLEVQEVKWQILKEGENVPKVLRNPFIYIALGTGLDHF